MTLVVDASVVVAGLAGGGADGRWAEEVLVTDDLAAPHLMPVETAHVLRRSVFAGRLSADVAALAHRDMLALRVALFDYEPVALRVWELRSNVTSYDAWYVALAEMLDAPLATLDGRLAQATGPRCSFRTPPTRTHTALPRPQD